MAAGEDSAFDRYRADVEAPLRRLFAVYGLPRAHWLVLAALANLLAQMAALVPPVVLGTAVDAVFAREPRPYRLPLVPPEWIPAARVEQFWFSVALIVGAFLLSGLLTWVYGVAANEFAHEVMYAVRTDSFEAMLGLDQAFFDDKQTGEVMSILNNDAGNLELFLDDALMDSTRLVVMVLGIAAVLFTLNWQLALVTLLAVPLMVAFTWWYMRTVAPRYRARQESMARFNTRIENAIAGVELTKTTASEPHEVDRVDDAAHDLYRRILAVLRLAYLYRPGMELLAGLSFGATFIVGGYWLFTDTAPGPLTGTLTVGTFVTFLFMTQRFVTPLSQVSTIVDQVQNATASAERVFGLYDIPAHVETDPDAVALEDPEGHVEYDDVSFAYGGAAGENSDPEEPILDGVSFEAEPGDTVGLVGPTGAGKSTLLKLLLRLYDVDSGAVRVDGHDVRSLELASLRGAVGYVSQDAVLFDGTIAENVRYGRFEASREEVVAAAEAAEAHAFIEDLPDGYETRVGERGVKLSGGQRQRVALARAVLRDPAVLILDEATSDVDTRTEMLIRRSLERVSADRTTFVIAHRLSTVRDADTILALEDGRVVERGSHEELLAADGLYAALWRVQAGEVDDLPAEFPE
jgi:ATP-binding cassette subfamily B protein